jgi:U3 small nucleolar RNA-associated protein 19
MDVVDDQVVENSLHLLERLNSMPKSKASIKNFYISEFSRPPDGAIQEPPDEQDEEDDWRAFFDTKPDEEVAGNIPADGRPSELSTHRALHSLQSHRAQFSAAWLAVLQRVKKSPEQSSRVLSILHRSILPHLIQPIQLMDWISACVDFGGIRTFYISSFLNSFRWVYRAIGF